MSDFKAIADKIAALEKDLAIVTIMCGALGTWCVILTAALGGVLALWGRR